MTYEDGTTLHSIAKRQLMQDQPEKRLLFSSHNRFHLWGDAEYRTSTPMLTLFTILRRYRLWAPARVTRLLRLFTKSENNLKPLPRALPALQINLMEYHGDRNSLEDWLTQLEIYFVFYPMQGS